MREIGNDERRRAEKGGRGGGVRHGGEDTKQIIGESEKLDMIRLRIKHAEI